MFKTLTIAAVATLAVAGTAHAKPPKPETVEATYQPRTQRFCVVPGVRDYTDQVHPPIHRRTCMNRLQWRSRGILFDAPEQFAAK